VPTVHRAFRFVPGSEQIMLDRPLRPSALASGDWSQLPPTALINVMLMSGRLERHSKRTSLALVCTSWAEAVEAADALHHELYLNRCVVDHLSDCSG
jgi:hypothetical protein